MKNNYLVNDLVVMEDVCNANCKYCITAGSVFKDKHKFLFYEDKMNFNLDKLLDESNAYKDGESLKEKLDYITDKMIMECNPYILKISGGEIFLIKYILDFIKKYESKFKRVQILTNGLLLNEEVIEQMKGIPNFSLQISMDGHTLDMNRYRVRSEKIQQKLCHVIELCNKNDIPLEINCVLTDANTDQVVKFAEYLCQYKNVLFLPYPVRGTMREKFKCREDQLAGVIALYVEYERLKSVLPPKSYIKALVDFMTKSEKECRCHIPYIMYQVFDDGVITPCPNIWFKQLGNVFETEKDNVFTHMRTDPFYSVVQSKHHQLEDCRNCFTPWEIINLYMEEKITDEEMQQIYLYNDPEILLYLFELRNSIKKNKTIKKEV